MDSHQALKARNFPTAHEEARTAEELVAHYQGPRGAYRMAFSDTEFLLREELRPIRMQLELLKPELIQQDLGIESTIVIFGSARILPRDKAEELLDAARAGGDMGAIRRAEKRVEMSRYYEEARRFGQLVTEGSRDLGEPVIVVTGGGPGIMEAGNRGAFDVGGPSMGLNIALPFEQAPNAYITPELCFQFHYFAIRKMHFLMRSVALVCFPGGFGTFDELFEVMTLTQTGKSRRRPILLFGREFWTKVVNFEALVEAGMIGPEDLDLFKFVDTAEEAWDEIKKAYTLDDPTRVARQAKAAAAAGGAA